MENIEQNYYIYTEIVNCGKIGKIALKSFHKYHNLKVYVYGTQKDFDWIEPNNNNILIPVAQEIIEGYQRGHLGTARLWSKIIKNIKQKYLIHFDSDVIFRENIIDDMIIKSKDYDLIGGIRNYKNNPHNNEEARKYQDVISTALFLFNKEKISPYDENMIARMCNGYNPLGHIIIDFFDPISFDMLKNGAKIFFLDFNDIGACNNLGSRDNIFKEINNGTTQFKIDFGKKLSHFSAVGSGMNFYENKINTVPKSYIDYAIDRYALFCKIFYNEDIGIDLKKYEHILNVKEWF